MPLTLRAVVVLLLSIAIARFINWAIYSWAYYSKQLGPWAAPTKGGSRTWRDHLPVVGWYSLRREGKTHGRWYWIRPLLIELLFPLFTTWYYVQYTDGTLPFGTAARALAPAALTALHWQFVGHLVLLTLMGVATFIDFDEQSIPDYVTIPGTVVGLFGAAFAPAWLPFTKVPAGATELSATFPSAWPANLNGSFGLMIALGIVAVWGFALLDRRWIARRGLGKAVEYFFARMFRSKGLWITVLAVTCGLALLIWYRWTFQAGGRWQLLLSSLLGLAFAGGITWGVRIAASLGLGVEALGFGDVTLMAMIGTYIGWQPSLLVFFIAPFVAILIVVIRAIVTGETATPYGPYLCAAVVILLVYWDDVWGWAAPTYRLGSLIVWIVVSCVVLMGAMLWIWRLIKQALGLGRH